MLRAVQHNRIQEGTLDQVIMGRTVQRRVGRIIVRHAPAWLAASTDGDEGLPWMSLSLAMSLAALGVVGTCFPIHSMSILSVGFRTAQRITEVHQPAIQTADCARHAVIPMDVNCRLRP